MLTKTETPVQPRRTPKTLTGDKTTHRLIRRTRMQASVQPAIRKNPARAEQSFSSPCSLEILSIEDPKQVQSSPKFAGTITKTLWTYPPKESMIHSMVWEESTKNRARTRFSQNVKCSRTLILRSSWILGVLH